MPPKNSLESEQTNSSLNQGPAADDYNIIEDAAIKKAEEDASAKKKADADAYINKMQNKSTLEEADFKQDKEIWESFNNEKSDNSLEKKKKKEKD